uniref:Reverse transcriptase domain-containing protein n=1 Tax=Chenopodium quinoa TaxID=63459 RepID=A0A803N1J3_CHEQI
MIFHRSLKKRQLQNRIYTIQNMQGENSNDIPKAFLDYYEYLLGASTVERMPVNEHIVQQDLMKAYDTMEWNFLEEMMNALQFPGHFIKLITVCVRSPRRIQVCKNDDERFLSLFKFYWVKSSAEKTFVYCAGIDNGVSEQIQDMTGFKKGRLPFKYLGVPICSKRLSAVDCEHLIDRMSTRIKVWSSRHLSFAARRTLDICKLKIEGGLGIKDAETWNKAALGKHVWAVAQNKENLRVRWVNAVYIKGKNWSDY